MRKIALLVGLGMLAVVMAAGILYSAGEYIIPGLPSKTQGGMVVSDSLEVLGNTRLIGNLIVTGSFSGASATAADSLRANLQFFMGGASIKKILPGVFTHDWANVTAGTTLDETQAVTGVTVADNWVVLIGPITDMSAGLILQCGARVSADGTIKMRLANKCATDVDNPSQSFWFLCIKL